MTRPTRVLHSAGNFRALLPSATHPDVDAIEADVWVRSNRLHAHHSRPLPLLPLMLEGRWLQREPAEPIDFAELLGAVEGCAELIVDLKSWLDDPAPALAHALLAVPARSHLSVTCESWAVANQLRAWVPDVRVAYSVRSERQLRRYIGLRIAGALPQVPVVVRHTLLHSAPELEALRHWAGYVGAWTVDDVARARELAAWGVDQLTSNELEVLTAL